MHGQLSDEAEARLISNLLHTRKPRNLRSRIFHQVDTLDSVGGSLPTSLDEASVERLQTSLLHPLITDHGSSADYQERCYPCRLISAIGRPDLNDGFEEGFQELAEGKEVGDEFEGRVQEEFLGSGVGEQGQKMKQR